MDPVLYLLGRAVVGLVQRLPLEWVARLGRGVGGLVYWLDARHRRVARRNLGLCFGGEKSPAQIRALARENFRRIGESFACAVKTAAMSLEELRPHVEFVSPQLQTTPPGQAPRRMVAAIGHFGNFELYARTGQFAPAYHCATTYRGFRQPSLNRLLQGLRQRSGCHFFERRFEGPALKAFMRPPGVLLGLLCDQAGGQNGLRLPFLGHECWTSPAPAVFALRYDCGLLVAICYRIGLARWRIEADQEIPIREDGKARSLAAIMADVNRAFDAAVRRDPANWFWVHNRWKSRGRGAGRGRNPKSEGPKREIRNPKAEGPKEIRNPKSEIRIRSFIWCGGCVKRERLWPQYGAQSQRQKAFGSGPSDFGLRISFGFPSDFGLRISDFALRFERIASL
jgi:KDO2-lipid IV(A) lauroyltransferase